MNIILRFVIHYCYCLGSGRWVFLGFYVICSTCLIFKWCAYVDYICTPLAVISHSTFMHTVLLLFNTRCIFQKYIFHSLLRSCHVFMSWYGIFSQSRAELERKLHKELMMKCKSIVYRLFHLTQALSKRLWHIIFDELECSKLSAQRPNGLFAIMLPLCAKWMPVAADISNTSFYKDLHWPENVFSLLYIVLLILVSYVVLPTLIFFAHVHVQRLFIHIKSFIQ